LIRISIDEGRCEGHGLCETAAPGVFELGDDGFTTVLLDPVPDALISQAEAGVRLCPVAALTIHGPDGDSSG
jgi:ferredoxin